MGEVINSIRAIDAYFLLGLAALFVFLLIYTISLSRKLAALGRRQSARLSDGNLGEIVSCITEQSDTLSALKDRHEQISTQQEGQSLALSSCVQKIGMVRFNAFDDVGGEQSFALVLLDASGNGVALSSLYGRQDSRFYAKAIVNGEGERPLSEEEQRALGIALAVKSSSARV